MDINQDPDRAPFSSPAPTKPLRIRKQSSPSRVTRSQHFRDSKKTSRHPKDTSYPPRTSSLRKYSDRDISGMDNRREKSHVCKNSSNSSPVRSTQSSSACASIFDTSISRSQSPTRSTISSYKELYLSDSAEIIGNFVPVNTSSMALPLVTANDHASFPNA
jgi:hypothetical protein